MMPPKNIFYLALFAKVVLSENGAHVEFDTIAIFDVIRFAENISKPS